MRIYKADEIQGIKMKFTSVASEIKPNAAFPLARFKFVYQTETPIVRTCSYCKNEKEIYKVYALSPQFDFRKDKVKEMVYLLMCKACATAEAI